MNKTRLLSLVALSLVITIFGSLFTACGFLDLFGDKGEDSESSTLGGAFDSNEESESESDGGDESVNGDSEENTEDESESDTDTDTDTDTESPDADNVGIGHNPKDNILDVGGWSDMLSGEQHKYDDFINYRGMLGNSYSRLTEDKELTVVYFGGSVTAGHGASNNDTTSWRAMIGNYIKKAFPKASVTNINRAIGESGTYLGSFRTPGDIITAAPDLLFIEYAINDYYYKSTYEESASQLETIIREVKTTLPDTDIVIVLVTDKNQLSLNKEGKLHTQAQAHEDIAKAYNISSLHVGRYLSSVTGYSADKWSDYAIDGVHPNDKGYEVYYRVVREFIYNALLNTDYSAEQESFVMAEQVSEYLFDGNRTNIQPSAELLAQSEALGGSGVTYSAEASFPNGVSPSVGRFTFYRTASRTDELVLRFNGTEICAYSFSKSVSWEVSVDGGAYVTVEGTSHNPVIFAQGLQSGEHTIKIRLKANGNVSIGSIFTRDETLATAKAD